MQGLHMQRFISNIHDIQLQRPHFSPTVGNKSPIDVSSNTHALLNTDINGKARTNIKIYTASKTETTKAMCPVQVWH